MNKVYRVIWSKVKNCWVVASEIAKRQGKNSRAGEETVRNSVFVATAAALMLGFSICSSVYAASGLALTGDGNVASGNNSLAWGSRNTASGEQATAWGGDTLASGYAAVAFGASTVAGAYTYNGEAVNVQRRWRDGNYYVTRIADGSQIAVLASLNDSNLSLDSTRGRQATAFGVDAAASGSAATAFGRTTVASGENATAFGRETRASSINATAFGERTVASGAMSLAFGNNTEASGEGATAFGAGTSAGGDYATALGSYSKADGMNSLASGYRSQAQGIDSVALGNRSSANADNSLAALGGETAVGAAGSVAIGSGASADVEDTFAIGAYANASGENTLALGNNATASGNFAIAMGYDTIASGVASTAVGDQSTASGEHASAYGFGSKATETNTTALGYSAQAAGNAAVAVGASARASGISSSSVGANAQASGDHAAAFGNGANAAGTRSVASGYGARAIGTNSVATGMSAQASGTNAIATGTDSAATGENSIATGYLAQASGNRAIALGDNNTVSGKQSGALGSGNVVTQDDTYVMGNSINSTQANSVVLGNNSSDRAATTVVSAMVNGLTYSNFAGQGSPANGVLSVGTEGAERQIINVAAGEVSAASTDAVNGSQLYAVASTVGNAANSLVNLLGGDAAVDIDGNISMSDIGGTGENTVHNAIQAAYDKESSVEAGSLNVTVEAAGTNATGGTIYTVDLARNITVDNVDALTVAADTVDARTVNTGTLKAGDTTVNSDGLTIDNGPSITKTGIDAGGNIITNVAAGVNDADAVNVSQLKQVADANQGGGFGLAAEDGNSVKKNLGETVSVVGDSKNITTSVTGGQVQITLADDINVNSVTATTVDADTVNADTVTADTVTARTVDAYEVNATTVTADTVDAYTVKAGDTTVNSDGLTINNGPSITKTGIDAADNKITNVADGAISATSKDAVNGSQIHQIVENIQQQHTAVTVNEGTVAQEGVYSESGNLQIKQDTAANGKVTYDIKLNDDLAIGGANGKDGSITINDKDGNTGVSVSASDGVGTIGLNGKDGITTIRTEKGEAGVDGQDGISRIIYRDPEGNEHQGATLDDGMKYSGDSGEQLKMKLNENVNIVGGITDTNQLTDHNIGVVSDGRDTLTVKLNKDIQGLNSVTSTTVNTNTVNTTTLKAGDTTVNSDGLTINNGPSITKSGVDAGGSKITNVAPGELSANSRDAVSGSQLYATNQSIENNTRNINKLDDRLSKVGAGAAALAALHPMDFDPDDKWNVAAGIGSYKDKQAAAIGAFYRPDENTMFSIGGTVGNGENMVNAGVTFALDRRSHVSRSRTALVKDVLELKQQVAQLTEAMHIMAGTREAILFPDVPENHWAYEYIEGLQKRGIIEGYPDGDFKGDRSMTRYEYAAMLYRALMQGEKLDARAAAEFAPELGRIRVDRIAGKDGDRNKIERVRVNDQPAKERDVYGSRMASAE